MKNLYTNVFFQLSTNLEKFKTNFLFFGQRNITFEEEVPFFFFLNIRV